jgi:hypothetical protein
MYGTILTTLFRDGALASRITRKIRYSIWSSLRSGSVGTAKDD